jgi:hypothetical protein
VTLDCGPLCDKVKVSFIPLMTTVRTFTLDCMREPASRETAACRRVVIVVSVVAVAIFTLGAHIPAVSDVRASASPARDADKAARAAEMERELRLAAAEREARIARAAEAKAQDELAALRERLARVQRVSGVGDAVGAAASIPSIVGAPEASARLQTESRFAPAALDSSHASSRLSTICLSLAPAVAVRPAPSGTLSARMVSQMSPWLWAGSSAELVFDPDGIDGALSTPWGEGRWGSLPRHPGLLWANFASRSHILWVSGCTLASFRCTDNETVIATTAQSSSSAAARRVIRDAIDADGLARACVASNNAWAPGASCLRSARKAPWLWATTSATLRSESSLHNGQLDRPSSLTLQASALAGRAAAATGTGCITQARDDLSRADAIQETARSCETLRWQCVQSASHGGRSYEIIALIEPPRLPVANGDDAETGPSVNATGRPASQMLVQVGDEALLVSCDNPARPLTHDHAHGSQRCASILATAHTSSFWRVDHIADDSNEEEEDEGDD